MRRSLHIRAHRFAVLAFALGIAFGCLGCAQKTDVAAEDPALPAIAAFIAQAGIDTTASDWKTRLPMPPGAAFADAHDYFWRLQTSKGEIVIRLMPDVAPMHVTSTIYLTELGFYDGLTFHRIIPGFMAQGGCPQGTGRGGPGYQYAGEFKPDVKHDRPGLLSMANAGPNTDGSQFFLTFVPTPHLDGRHTIFGEVVEGMATLQALEAVGSRAGAPSERVVIERAVIEVEPRTVPGSS
jgi:peptidyl-prolyl cis-trans isomerase B (cyclophilin B)